MNTQTHAKEAQPKLAWPILGRILVFVAGLSFAIYLTAKNSAVFADPALAPWTPTLLLVSLAIVLLFARSMLRKSVLSLLGGERLQQNPAFWRRLDGSLAALFVVLAVLSALVSRAVPADLWLKVRFVIPLFGILAFAFMVPDRLAARSG